MYSDTPNNFSTIIFVVCVYAFENCCCCQYSIVLLHIDIFSIIYAFVNLYYNDVVLCKLYDGLVY